MSHINSSPVSWRLAAVRGATIGIWLTFAYAVLVALYAIVRSSLRIQTALASGDALQMMFGTAVTLAFGILIFAVVMALVSAVIGGISAIVLQWLLLRFNPRHASTQALFIGLGLGIGCWFVVNLILLVMPGSRLTLAYPETYLFWFAVPGLIYVVASVLTSRTLNVRAY